MRNTAAIALLLMAGSLVLGQATQPSGPGGTAEKPVYGVPITTEINAGKMITYRSSNQSVSAYFVTPKVPETQKTPSVVLIHDIFGMTEFARKQADDFARQGYAVLLPNLYSRVAGGEKGLDASGAWVAYEQTTDAQIMQDLKHAVELLNEEGKPTAKQPIGVVGHDMGGIFAMKMAGMDLRVAAAVNYYGRILYATTSPQRPVSPVEDLFNMSAPLLSFYGMIDPQVPAAHVKTLESRLQNNPQRTYYEVIKLPDVGHSFMVPDRQGYNVSAAKEAAEKTRSFLARYLRAAPKPVDE